MLAFMSMLFLSPVPRVSAGTVLQGVNLGNLPDYLLAFVGTPNGSGAFNLQGASDGYQGDIAVNADPAGNALRSSGSVAYQGTMITDAATLGAWQTNIINNNTLGGSFPLNNAVGITGQSALISGLQNDFSNAMSQINALPATPGFESVSSTSLNGLNESGNPNKLFVINITSGLSVSSKITITGDPDQIFVLRWDTAPISSGYQGQVKFQSGGAIVPGGGLIPTNFINVAGDINSSGGGTTPPPPYPQGVPIQGGSLYNGGGFFTGYWLTTGDPTKNFQTSSLSNAIFNGGWFTSTTQFSMTSGTSGGAYDPPPIQAETSVPEPSSIVMMVMGLGTVGLVGARLRRFRH
jgi:hypothetical protein